jgi:hypothetical protein
MSHEALQRNNDFRAKTLPAMKRLNFALLHFSNVKEIIK